ncbi:MAG: TonB-dependent copper receptor [Nibricoccus sp.]
MKLSYSHRSLPTLVAVAGLCASAPHATFAHDEPIQLAAIVVTARPSEQPLAVSIDPKAPAQPIPAQDGAEALRSIPGFNVIRKGGTDGDPVLRGMAGSRLGILVDGQTILGGCSNRMDPPTAYVFPDAFDRVTVLKGPQSVIHGAGNSAGVVLFEHTPKQFETPRIDLEGALTFGSFGRNDQYASARAGAPAGYAQIAGTRSASDDYEDGSGRSIASRYERWSAHTALGWTPDKNTLVELSSTLSDGEAAYADRLMDGISFARENVGLRVRRAGISDTISSIEAGAYVNAVDHVMDNYSLRPFVPSMMMPGRAASNPDRRTIGGRLAIVLTPFEPLRVELGADHQANRHRVRSTSNQTNDPYEIKERVRDADLETTGLFAEATQSLSQTQRLIGGVRADFWEGTDYRATVATGMMGSAKNPTANTTRTLDLPSGFLRYENDVIAGTTLFIGVGHAQRAPDYWELFGKESATTVSAFNTRPEKTTQVDLGSTYRSGDFSASVSVFAGRIDDFILIENGIIKPSGMMGTRSASITRNIDAGTAGGELSLAYAPVCGWNAQGSLSYVYSDNNTDARPLAQQPPLEGRLGLSYSTCSWSVGSLARIVGAQHRYAVNQGNIVGQDLGPSDGFSVFSLNAAWKPAAWLQLSAGVDNLFNREYAEHLSRGGAMVAGFPPPATRVNEPGRSFWAKANLKW